MDCTTLDVSFINEDMNQSILPPVSWHFFHILICHRTAWLAKPFQPPQGISIILSRYHLGLKLSYLHIIHGLLTSRNMILRVFKVLICQRNNKACKVNLVTLIEQMIKVHLHLSLIEFSLDKTCLSSLIHLT